MHHPKTPQVAHPPARLALGIDVGGTKIAAGLVDLTIGRILARQVVPTLPGRGGAAVLDDVVALATALVAEAPGQQPISGIGVGVCELVDPTGAITSGHTVAWQGMPVAARLSAIAPTVVAADIRAHALAEARYGAGRGLRTFMFVTIGTGISSCLVLDGQPHAGAHGNALVLATAALTFSCTTCGSVLRPVLEDIASGPALVARYNQQTQAGLTRAEEVLAAAAHDPAASMIVQSAGEALGVSIGWLVNVLDPEAVIMGGGLGVAEGLYWDSMVAATRAHIWADSSRDVTIMRAALGSDAGVIGAAASVR